MVWHMNNKSISLRPTCVTTVESLADILI